MQGKHGHLSREQKQLALRLHSKGWRLIDIAREVGCTAPMVGKMAREGRHLDGKPFGWEPRAGHLTVLDRERILVGLARGDSLTLIARHLGRAVSTISREVRRGGGRAAYSAWRAHEHARRSISLCSYRDVGSYVVNSLAACGLGEPFGGPGPQLIVVAGYLAW